MIDKISKLLQNNTILKILSFIIALIAYLIISQTGSPWWRDLFQQSQVINNVVVTTSYDNNYFVTGIPDKMPITITGSENEIMAAKNQSDSMKVIINLDGYDPGHYTITNQDMKFDVPAGVKASSVINELDVDIQQKVTQDVPIDLNYIDKNVNDGFMFNVDSLSQNFVTVTGGSETVGTISSIEAIVNLDEIKVSGSSGDASLEAPLVAYDQAGNKVENISLSTDKITVKLSYTTDVQEIPITFEYKASNDQYVATICPVDSEEACNVDTQSTVKIFGDSNKIKAITDKGKLTYSIDLSNITSSSGTVQGVALVPNGVFVIGGNTKQFNVTLESGVTKTINDINIETEGLNPKFSIKAVDANDSKVNVTVTGANSVINGYTDANGNQVEGLNASDLQVYIDLSDITAPGTYEVPIIVNQNKPFTYKLNHQAIKIEVVENS